MGDQQSESFTADEFAEFKQYRLDHKQSMEYVALLKGEGRNEKEQQMIEKLKRENELKGLMKNKWMVLSPMNTFKEHAIEAQFDTGAALNFITEALAQLLGLEKLPLDPPRVFETATGDPVECKSHAFARWRGQRGNHGQVEFFYLPEKSSIIKLLIGTDDKECWNELLEEQPKDLVCWTALSEPKASETNESAVLLEAVQNDQSQLRRKRQDHEEKRGSSSKKSKGSRANDKKTKRN